MKPVFWSLVASSFAFAGCMELEGSPELGATEQAVTTPWVTTHSCGSGACTNITISGSGASVCFITELDGDLAHEGSARIHKGFSSVWFLDILSPNNNNIQVRTACINLRGTDPQTLVTWSSQSQHNLVFHGTASTRCFLSEVTANNTAAFTTFDNNFFIANQQPGPFDYMVLGAFPSSPGANVTIGMECFATTSLLAGLAYGNGSPNPVNNTLLSGANAQGAVCGLTGLGGIFSTASTTDGIRTYQAGTDWGWEASGWKGIWGQCVR